MKVKKLTIMAVLTAVALTVFVIEAQFPPLAIGGIKLGVANVVTLVAMVFVGRREAGSVLIMRIILGSVFCGTVMSFMFSLVGGVLAYAVMCLLINRFDKKQLWVVSVFGALAHNGGQLLVAWFVTGTVYIVTLFPLLIISGIICGAFTGICAQKLWISPLRRFSLNKDKSDG